MAPRTRSNRIEMLAREKMLASGQTFNTSGFAALPDELYLEIISHFPAYPIPRGFKSVDIEAVRDRHLTLLALSQTCRSLRPAFLRYLWQRIEVYDGMETGKGQLHPRNFGRRSLANKTYAEELVQQLEVVTVREPNLARHVNFINVLVTDYSVNTVLAELARCIALFPNLHTVQLHFRFYRFKFPDTFKTYQYPSIKNVYICPKSIMFPSACPEVRVVSPANWNNSTWWPQSTFENAIHQYPALEVLGPFALNGGDARTIAGKWPKLREIFLYPSAFGSGFVRTAPHKAANETEVFLQEYVSDLSKLRHLRIINIIMGSFMISYDVDECQCVQRAKEILSQCSPNSEDKRPRKVVLYYEGREPVTHLVQPP